MWRLSVAGVSVAILGIAAYSLAPTPAYACGLGIGFDPVATAEIIVEGRIVDAEVSPEQPGAYFDIRAEISVQRVWKAQAALEMIAQPRLDSPSDSSTEQIGNLSILSTGVCSGFGTFDPTGSHMIVGLTQRDDGTLIVGHGLVFYRGDASGGERYDAALQRMASYPGAAALPALGSGPNASVSDSAVTLVVAGILTLMGTALLSLAVLSRNRVRRSA